MSGNSLIGATITGLPELKAALLAIPDKLRVRALRNALAAGARVVQRAARGATPVLDLGKPGSRLAFRKGYRKPQTVRKALSVRTSKVARRRGDVGVFVNVRPVKGSGRGAKSPRDPFYWRWLNFGWTPAGGVRTSAQRRARRRLNASGAARRIPGARFMEAGAARLSDALQVFLRTIGPAIEKLNRPKAPPP